MRILPAPIWLSLALASPAFAANATPSDDPFARGFETTIRPFIESYCVTCHGGEKPEAGMDLSEYTSIDHLKGDLETWHEVQEKLFLQEMPPAKAKEFPTPEKIEQVVAWLQALRKSEIDKHAGDPGPVLSRRFSNVEYNYTIRDLTGVDLKPTRDFPIDPTNTAGFDNSGESLVMSSALLTKYLQAARDVASHLYLKPKGFAFAPHPMLSIVDRDKFYINSIIALYHRQNTEYADYFQAAWQFKHRGALGKRNATLEDFAAAGNVSARYLATVWSMLEGASEEVGPGQKLQTLWRQLPAPTASQSEVRQGCEQMRDYVVQFRKKVEMRFLNFNAGVVHSGQQPLLLWKNLQYARHRRMFDRAQLQVEGEPPAPVSDVPEPGTRSAFGAGRTILVNNKAGDPDLVVPAGQREKYEAAFARFCSVFPDMFYMEQRGRHYFAMRRDTGRYLSAGFHNVVGYFRDDQPLYELILDEKQQRELDELWREFDFVADATTRMYSEFALGGTRDADVQTEGEGPEVTLIGDEGYRNDVTSERRLKQLQAMYLEDAQQGGTAREIAAVMHYFDWANGVIRWVERAKVDAEASHLEALQDFAQRAYRRPLQSDERTGLIRFYRNARDVDGVDHETAMRESIVSVLMSPDFFYRVDLAAGGEVSTGVRPISAYDLASRLSYFLWSSMPDAELLARAAAGDLNRPEVMAAQARRMLKDPRVRALAVEFGGNWLDFRQFESLGTVNRERFPGFNDGLRQAMFEEPVRFLQDVFEKNRSVLDLLYANDTFVNRALAEHYGMPHSGKTPDEWVRIADASPYDRGGLLPMGAFLTKNAPGLRTSPVKRGNWVVKYVLGERIPAPPPNVPELPADETVTNLSLRDMLARHRENPNCAACHARFDSLGLVFEGYGPVGERRKMDLGGRPVDASAEFPGGSRGAGLAGLRDYIRNKRQADFINNLCGKLVAFGLNRSLIPSDEILISQMQAKAAADGYRFGALIETLVTSPQFLTKRTDVNLAAK